MVTVPARYSRGTNRNPTTNAPRKFPTYRIRYVTSPPYDLSGTPTNVATLREEPTMEIASTQVGIERPPRKNSSALDFWRLSFHAATSPMTSISAKYPP